MERGRGERYIPASRLSDGTLRYMALAAILLDPDPPPLVVIEEPELGLHPDLTLGIGRMLVEASQRMQLVVTTHSTGLIDALDECPSSVVVCEKDDGESLFERLEPKYLTEWLERVQPWAICGARETWAATDGNGSDFHRRRWQR